MSYIELYVRDIGISDLEYKEKEDVYYILHKNKFVSYIDISPFSLNDIRARSRPWVAYKKKITKIINTNIKSKRDVVCLIPVVRNHAILKKSIDSIQKQTVIPHILLIVSCDIDKKFAVLYNFEYVYADSSDKDEMLNQGIVYVQETYPKSSVTLCYGSEIYTKKWISECLSIKNRSRVVGFQRDYVINKQCTVIYEREAVDIFKYGVYIGNKMLGKSIEDPTYIQHAKMVTICAGDISNFIGNYKTTKLDSLPIDINITKPT